MTRAGPLSGRVASRRDVTAMPERFDDPDHIPNSQRLLLNVLSWLLAMALAALVIAHSFAAYLVGLNPRWALAVGGTYTAAELKIANGFMATHGAESDGSTSDTTDLSKGENVSTIHDRITRALYQDPLNARAFELLGVIEASHSAPAADTFMQAAVARSRRTPAAHYWLIRRKLAQGDQRGAVALADTLLRIRPHAMPIIAPIIAKILTTPGRADEVVEILGVAPAWRQAFFHFLDDHEKESAVLASVLSALRGTPRPPTQIEVDGCITSLVRNKKFELAYYTWLQFLPAVKLKEAKLLFNSDFRFEPTPSPFDWSMRQGDGVVAEITTERAQQERKVLSIDFGGGGVSFRPITQTIILTPGRYYVSVRAKGLLNGSRGLQWQVACIVPLRKVIGETPMLLGAHPQWDVLSSRFEVRRECKAQTISLIHAARSASETLLSGSVAFADLELKRE